MTEINFEKELFSTASKLELKDETLTANIVDAELDILNCSFNDDDCVSINTKNLPYIELTLDNLKILRKLIVEARNKYNAMYESGELQL